MLFGIGAFEIVKKHVGERQDRFKSGPWHVAAGIDRTMDPFIFHLFQQFRAEPAMQQRFAAGKRDAAAVRIKNAVLQQFVCGFIHRDVFSEQFQRPGRTCLRAFAAGFAVGAAELMHAIHDLMAGTDFGAFAAAGAFRIMDRQFRLHEPAFRIVAPDAAQ